MYSSQTRSSTKIGEDGCRYRTVYEQICQGDQCKITESTFRKCAGDRNEVLMSTVKREEPASASDSMFPSLDIPYMFDPNQLFQQPRRRPTPRDPYIDHHGEDI